MKTGLDQSSDRTVSAGGLAESDAPLRDSPASWLTQGGAPTAHSHARTIISLRWIAICAQVVMLAFYFAVGRFHIPYAVCWALIGGSLVLNLVMTRLLASQGAELAWRLALQLTFDVLQFATLMGLTGGIMSYFAMFLVVPAAWAGGNLPLRPAAFVCGLSIAAVAAISIWFLPPPWQPAGAAAIPALSRALQAVAIATAIVFGAAYSYWAARGEARMALALHMTETVLAREQRLSALGGLAAAAAHELGTPLATISIVAKELARETPPGPLRNDAWLLVEQAQRCRDILRKLAASPPDRDELHERMSLLQLVREVIEPYAAREDVRAEALVTGPSDVAAPDVWRRPEVLHAMTSIVENAFDFASAEILVAARFDAEMILLEVRDDGPGFSPEALARLGSPYFTSRPGAEGSRTGHVGMGLGFFIAKTLLERTGATVSFANGRFGGAIVAARWPRTRMEAVERRTPGVGGMTA